MPLSLPQRQQMQARLQAETFDLLIIGGGINGAGVARDAALRGYRVALLEQEDFGFGTSSRSSRLVHGGVRYLEHGHIGLVFESLRERAQLARLARHLVRPLPFVFPVYQGSRSLLTVNLGLWLYDALALFRNYRHHKRLSARGVMATVPGIRPQGLRGGVYYYDYQTDDARLVLENILSAVAEGAVALSYVRVEGYERTAQDAGVVQARDRLTDASFTVRCRVMVCAAGPWTDHVMALSGETQRYLQTTKGVHLVLPGESLPLDVALVMQHPQDGRILFALPYHECTVLGTTDTDFAGDPATVHATAADVHYLLDAARHYFPQAALTPDKVIATWAGVRPLLSQEDTARPSAASREHRIEAHPDGVVVMAGGKLTTFRHMAAECVDATARLIADAGGPSPTFRPPTQRLPLPGTQGLSSDDDLKRLAATLDQDLQNPHISRHLVTVYGSRAGEAMALAHKEDTALTPIVEGLPYVWAEIPFAVCEEMALTLSDVLVRRTQIFYRDQEQGLSVAEEVAARMARYLGWDAAEQAQQVQTYRDLVAANRRWKRSR
jgi:glycerol-3-phosphate dehydrogenase